MKNQELIANMLDSFYEKVASDKAAIQKQANETLAAKEEEGKKQKKDPGMGAAGTEMNADVTKGISGISAPDSKSPVAADAVVAQSVDGPRALTADESINEGENQVKVEKQHKEARAERLGNAILSHVAELRKQAAYAGYSPIEKLAAENPRLRKAIDMSYTSFTNGWLRGFEKKAEDIKAMLAAGTVNTPAEAEAVLNKIAAEDPAAVLPEEALAAAEAAPAAVDAAAAAEDELSPEQTAALEQLADEMAAQGVTPDDVIQAAQAIDELQAAGVAPEEIVAAASELQNEEASTAAAAEKQAAARRNIIKDYIRGLNSR